MRNEFRSCVSGSMFRRIAIALISSTILAGASLANAQSIFIQMAEIRGESVAKGLEGAIEADSWSWGIENPTSFLDGRYAGARANFGKLTFVHGVDMASPALMQHCASGKRITDVRLSQLRQVRDGQTIFLVIDLKDVIVSEISVSGVGRLDAPPTEQVSLSYSAVKVTYTPMRPDGSKAGSSLPFQWDLAKNAP